MLLKALSLALGVLTAAATANAAPFKFFIPTPEELYLKGDFKPAPALPWHERHQGEELDLSQRRPVVELGGTIFEQAYGKPGTKLVANVFHNGRFYIARIPNDGVGKVYFQLAYFPPKILGRYIAAHSLLRFNMKKPIELIAEVPDARTLTLLRDKTVANAVASLSAEIRGLELVDFAISAEAQWTKYDKKKAYNLVRGQRSAFVQIVRMVSMEERFKEFYRSGNPATQIELDQTKGLDAILTEGIRKSQSEGISKIYNTLGYNCTTLAFDIVEAAQGLRDNRLGFVRDMAERRVPIISPVKLEYYGGVTAMPIQLDTTLVEESRAAYEQVIIKEGHSITDPAIPKENLPIIETAIKTWRATYGQMCKDMFGA